MVADSKLHGNWKRVALQRAAGYKVAVAWQWATGRGLDGAMGCMAAGYWVAGRIATGDMQDT